MIEFRDQRPVAGQGRLNREYVENWSFWGDIRLIMRTLHSRPSTIFRTYGVNRDAETQRAGRRDGERERRRD